VAKHKGIRIGWDGSIGHQPDLDIIRPVIAAIKRDYPDVTFVTMGYKPDFSDEHHGWADMMAYPKTLASLGIDIGLAPLIDSSFNRCKSNLRWMNYSALKIPVVYSPVENQKNLPGIKADSHHDWYEAISTLIEDKELRRKLGNGQNKYLKEHFDMKNNVQDLARWLEELPRSDRY
jgi:glycosyltransferase involved in cell wall biosynthesis